MELNHALVPNLQSNQYLLGHYEIIPNTGCSTATQRILLRFRTGAQQVKVHVRMHNSHIDHVMIQSELKIFIGVKKLGLQGASFQVGTDPKAMVQDFHLVKPVATVRFRFPPYPELFYWVGTFANTSLDIILGSI